MEEKGNKKENASRATSVRDVVPGKPATGLYGRREEWPQLQPGVARATSSGGRVAQRRKAPQKNPPEQQPSGSLFVPGKSVWYTDDDFELESQATFSKKNQDARDEKPMQEERQGVSNIQGYTSGMDYSNASDGRNSSFGGRSASRRKPPRKKANQPEQRRSLFIPGKSVWFTDEINSEAFQATSQEEKKSLE